MSNIYTYSDNYKKAKALHQEIIETFETIETGGLTLSKDRYAFVKLKKDIRILISTVSKIDILQISKEIKDEEFIEKLRSKLQEFYESAEYIEKRLLAYEYVDDLLVPVKKYLKHITGDSSNYRKWAKHPDELAHKFIGMLTHPDNIDIYINQIKRIALGTMTQKEFNKIFQTAKHKMVTSPDTGFQSFSDYKNNAE